MKVAPPACRNAWRERPALRATWQQARRLLRLTDGLAQFAGRLPARPVGPFAPNRGPRRPFWITFRHQSAALISSDSKHRPLGLLPMAVAPGVLVQHD